jgi:hypothetical protein
MQITMKNIPLLKIPSPRLPKVPWTPWLGMPSTLMMRRAMMAT